MPGKATHCGDQAMFRTNPSQPQSPPFIPWPALARTDGLSMIELIVAFVVLQVAIVTFAQLFTAGLDFSRNIRRIELAQMLAHTKMEELLRTVPEDPALQPTTDEPDAATLITPRPASFEAFAHAHSEYIERFRWLAETHALPNNRNMVGITLHVYIIDTWEKTDTQTNPEEDFYLSEDRERFTYAYVPPGNNAVQFMRGREKLRITSAVALKTH
ncbi:MAG: hypothetical protein Kow0099_28460 [Candidatus Abyssubacteria bacterium]